MAIWAADVCSRAARQLICIEPTGLRLRHKGKTDPQCGTVQFCFHSGRLACSARTGFRAVTTPLNQHIRIREKTSSSTVLSTLSPYLPNEETFVITLGTNRKSFMCDVVFVIFQLCYLVRPFSAVLTVGFCGALCGTACVDTHTHARLTALCPGLPG